jgi:hypothetical protein
LENVYNLCTLIINHRAKQMTDENKKPEELTLVERAEKAATALKQENDRQEELLKRQSEENAFSKLGGQTNAGQIPQTPKVETEKEYAARMLRGGK